MSVTVELAEAYVKALPGDANVPALLSMAEAMLREDLGFRINKVPDEVLEYATLRLLSAMWIDRKSPAGVYQYDGEGPPIRLARDIYTSSVGWLLAKYKGIGPVG